MKINTTPEVDAIGRMSFSGNVIPHTWYSALRFKNGKPDLVAIILLAEIVSVPGKFPGDMFSRTYQEFANQFGFTKRQVSNAIHRLVKVYKVIRCEFRIIETEDARKVPNVLFLAPIPAEIHAITHAYYFDSSDSASVMF